MESISYFVFGIFLTKSRSLLAGTISVEVKCPRETDMMGNMPEQPCLTITVQYLIMNIEEEKTKYKNTEINDKT